MPDQVAWKFWVGQRIFDRYCSDFQSMNGDQYNCPEKAILISPLWQVFYHVKLSDIWLDPVGHFANRYLFHTAATESLKASNTYDIHTYIYIYIYIYKTAVWMANFDGV